MDPPHCEVPPLWATANTKNYVLVMIPPVGLQLTAVSYISVGSVDTL
jgi:hypothetical protein